MKRAAWILAVAGLFAASNRDAYRAAYRNWRQADPNLERDAATPAPGLAARANSVAGQAAKYGAERSAFLRSTADEQGRALAWLDSPAMDTGDVSLANLSRAVRENVETSAALNKKNLDTFANDPDPAIQRLKSMHDRENAALAALANAVAERQSAGESARSAAAAVEAARKKALSADRDLEGAMKTAAEQADREASLWAEYYRKLGEAPVPAPAPPVTASAPPPATAVATPFPLSRYTGAWTYPSKGLFHGPQPEFVDVVVHEEAGRATGTLFGRFKVGSKEDPVLRFDFSGEFKNTRNQVFSLETSDGAKGSIELIPGPAFNLLEINFQTEPKPGKVRQGNMVLVKK